MTSVGSASIVDLDLEGKDPTLSLTCTMPGYSIAIEIEGKGNTNIRAASMMAMDIIANAVSGLRGAVGPVPPAPRWATKRRRR